jgi:hypothetical protein
MIYMLRLPTLLCCLTGAVLVACASDKAALDTDGHTGHESTEDTPDSEPRPQAQSDGGASTRKPSDVDGAMRGVDAQTRADAGASDASSRRPMSGPGDTAGDAATAENAEDSSVPLAPGCVAASSHDANRKNPVPSRSFGCMYPSKFQDTSPSIQVSKDGVLFVARTAGGVLRSSDHGKQWSDIAIPPAANGDSHADGFHGYVHIDPRTDRVYYVSNMGAASCGGLSGALLSWSDDGGESWSGRTVACDTFDWGKVLTGPAPEGNGYPSVVYFFGVGQRPVGGQRFVYRSLDAGKTWERMKNIAAATTEAGVGAAAPDGTVYFDYPEYLGFDGSRKDDKTYPYKPENECRQMVAVSEDFGVTWRQEPVPGSNACGLLYGQQRVAVDSDGTVYVTWVDDNDAQLYLSYSHDKAHTWSKPVNVMTPGMTYSLTQGNIVAGKPGQIVIAGLQTSVETRPETTLDFKGLYGGEGFASHAILTRSFDAASATPHFESVDLDPPGDPSIADGEGSNEGNAYLGISSMSESWAVFSRHSPTFSDPGWITAARMMPQ